MKPVTFTFVRHGESQANAANVIAAPETPLTQRGKEQAYETAAILRPLGITRIATSPYLRARQTAAIIAGELGVATDKIRIITELHERELGSLIGHPKSHESAWYLTSDTAEGIESCAALQVRMASCLGILKEMGQNEKLLVVGHAISGYYLLQLAAGKMILESFDPPTQLDNAAFIEVKVNGP